MKFIKAIIETAKDPDLLSSGPHHGDEHYQGFENDDKCCPNCGLVECTCDLQGLSESEKEAITPRRICRACAHCGEYVDIDIKELPESKFDLRSRDEPAYLTVRSDGSWEYSRPGDCPTHCAFPDDVNINCYQQRIGDLLVTIQEVK